MRWLLPLLFLVGCGPKHTTWPDYPDLMGRVMVDKALDKATQCYETFEGISFDSYDVECPPQEFIQAELDKMAKRTGIELSMLSGTRVVFTPYRIRDCGENSSGNAMGCANYPWAVVELAGPRHHWEDTLLHEICHLAVYAYGYDAVACHNDPWLLYSFTRYLSEDFHYVDRWSEIFRQR